MKIKADFKPGDKITEIPASWFSAVGSFVNNLVGVNNIAVKRPHGPVTESSPVEIEFIGATNVTTLNLSDATPEKDTLTGSAGTGTTATRSDHKHPISDPAAATTYASVPTFWGEFSAVSGGGATPTTSAWVANGQTGHTAGQGVAFLFLERIYLDNTLSTPNLVAVQRRVTVAEDGRILAVSSPFEFVVSPTVAV